MNRPLRGTFRMKKSRETCTSALPYRTGEMTNKKLQWVVAAVAAVIAGTASSYVWQTRFSPTAKIQTLVKSRLNDPESAMFSDVKYFPDTGGGCGFVNARNRMGGYVGNFQFTVDRSGTVEFEPADPSPSTSAEEKLAVINTQLAFYDVVEANCPGIYGPSSPPKAESSAPSTDASGKSTSAPVEQTTESSTPAVVAASPSPGIAPKPKPQQKPAAVKPVTPALPPSSEI